MITKIRNNKCLAVAIAFTAALLIGCDDDPGAENYYTAKGDMANTYLTSRPETYSKFVDIINKSNLVNLDLLGTYGSYTVFAPTNDAVDAYLAGRQMSSVDDLSVADCDTIACTHIIEQSYFTTDFSDATLPTQNMLDRYLTITCDSDVTSDPGKVQIVYFVNQSAKVILRDDSVENGVVHTVDKIIDATTEMLPDLMKKDSTISLFYNAMKICHLDTLMRDYKDESYHLSPDSIDEWFPQATAVEVDMVGYMENRYYGYTGFIEPNEVYAAHGINNLEDLKAYAKQIYDEVYPEDADVTDYKDRRNSLNRFVSYHFLPARIIYNDLTADNQLLKLFDRRHWDVADWYETMLPYSIMKISFPSGSQAGRYVNRRGVQNRKDARGVFEPGAKIKSPSESGRNLIAVNGVYHYIEDIIDYGYTTQNVVLNERMRIDASTLSPDFLTSGARGHGVVGTGGCPKYPGRYGKSSTSRDPDVNPNHCIGFKRGSVTNFDFTQKTHMHVRNRYLNFWSYQGDELLISGMFDITFRIPPVPEGEYELRIQTCLGFDNRGILQVYLDGKPCGIPLDMRKQGDDPSIGYKSDSSLGDQEAIAAYDKAMHNRGWMKGPLSYGSSSEDGEASPNWMRNTNNQLRRIWTTFHSDGRTDHYLRVQQKLDLGDMGTFAFDYMELCPRSVYNNEYYPEDKY